MEENREFDRRIRDILPEGENIKTFLEKCNPNTKNTVEEKIAAYKLWAERVFGFTIEWFHEEWVGMYLRHDRSCVMAPRQHGKTTVLAIVFPLWISFFGKNKSFLIVSNVMDHSTHIIEEIRHHIFDNELLHLMRPSHRGEMAWTRTKIVTNKDCTILCRPYRYNIKGGTYDFVLCVPSDTLIETKDGGKRIDEVKEGMEVKTHLGRFRKILRIFKNPSKPIYEIKYGKNGSVSVTEDHPVLVKRGSQQPKFIRASRIWMTDKLCYPLRGKVETLRIPQKGRKPIEEHVIVNADVARLFGLYAAEGSSDRSSIKFTYNKSELDLIDFTMKSIHRDFKMEPKLDNSKPWNTTVYCCSVALKKLFEEKMGVGSFNKKIPDVIKKSNNHIKANFLYGVFLGDGSKTKLGTLISLTSKRLIDELEILCNELGLKCRKKCYVNASYSCQSQWSLYITASSMRILSSLVEENRHRRFIYYSIKSITKKNTKKQLYNLEVEEDNSYIADGVAVHNCDEASLFKDHDIFFRAICPTVIARKGHIMVIGTPESELDLLYELKLKSEHDDSTYVFKKYQAVLEDGSPLWPVKYPKDHLVKVKENDGSIQFMREYMCEMVDEGTQAFPPKLIVKAFDLSQRLRSSPLADHIYFIGSDLALSPQGDYIVHLVLAKAPDGRLLITDIQRSRGRGGSEYATQVDAVENLYKTYNAVKCSIDRSLYGDILINALKTERHVPAEGVDFHPEARNTMINNLLRLFENGRIVIPRDENDAETIRQTDTLISELSKFILSTTRSNQRTYMSIGKHDDTVMALAMAAWSADQQRKFMAYMRAV